MELCKVMWSYVKISSQEICCRREAKLQILTNTRKKIFFIYYKIRKTDITDEIFSFCAPMKNMSMNKDDHTPHQFACKINII